MASILKVDTIQDQAGNNIISESANVITIGASGDTITVPAGATVSGFTSAGIDDNATSTAITIDSSGNVGIGTSSPTSNLHVESSTGTALLKATGTDTGATLVLNGNKTSNTAGIGSIQFQNSGDSVGMIRSFRESANDAGGLSFWTQATGGSNSEKMRIDSSGNVGIGGTTPSAKLDVRSQINVTNASGVSLQGLTGTRYGYSTSYRTILLGSTGTGTSKNIAIGYDPSSNTSGNFAGNGTEILFPNTVSFITPNSTDDNYIRPVIQLKDGTVGIGESTPLGKFHIRDGDSATTSVDSLADELVVESSSSGGMTILTPASSTGNIFFGDPNSNSIGRVQYSHSSNAMLFATNGSERMRIDSSGNVGIGTTSPQEYLSINVGLTDTEGLGLQYSNETKGGILLKPQPGEVRIGAFNSSGTYFTSLYSNNSERMRITTDGEVKFTNTPPVKSLDFGSCTVTLANNAFIDFPATSGFWVITETVQTGQSACMVAGGGSTAIAGQTGSAFNNADSGTFRFFKVTSPAAAFRFKNSQGNTCSFGICHISTRPST